jgi:hypothetical protein
LQLRPVGLVERALNDGVALRSSVDQQRIVDGVGGDPHARQQPARRAAAGLIGEGAAQRGGANPAVLVGVGGFGGDGGRRGWFFAG